MPRTKGQQEYLAIREMHLPGCLFVLLSEGDVFTLGFMPFSEGDVFMLGFLPFN